MNREEEEGDTDRDYNVLMLISDVQACMCVFVYNCMYQLNILTYMIVSYDYTMH